MPRLSRRAVILVAIGAVALASTGSAAAATWSRTATAVPASAHASSLSLHLAVDSRGSSGFAWGPYRSNATFARVRGPGGGFGPIQLVVPSHSLPVDDEGDPPEEGEVPPQLVADSLGGATLLWETSGVIYAVQRLPGKLFGRPMAIASGFDLFDGNPNAIAVDSAGTLRLIVAVAGSNEVALIERARGHAFTAPRDLGGALGGGGSPSAIGSRGDVAGEASDTFPRPGIVPPMYASVRAAGSPRFGPPELTGLPESAGWHDVATTFAVSPDGSVAVLRADRVHGVRVSVRPPGGRFGTPQVLDAHAPGYDGARVALRYGSKGDLIAVWGSSSSPTSGKVRAALAGRSGRFGPAHTLGTGAYSRGNDTNPEPVIAISKDGQALIGWTRNARPREQLWVVRRRHGHSFERATSVMSIYPNAFAIAGGDSRFAAAAVSPFDHSVHTRTEPSG